MSEIGMVAAFAGAVPTGWLPCDGAAYGQAAYPALYAEIGTQYGDDGAGTFRVPNLENRVVLGVGAEGRGATGGAASVTLTVDQLPEHSHSLTVSDDEGDTDSPTQGHSAVAADDIYGNGSPSQGPSDSIGSTGGGQPVSTMPPYLRLVFAIYAGV